MGGLGQRGGEKGRRVMAANFGNDLKFSHDQANAPFWEEVYRMAFPDFATMTDVRKDGWAQRGGIDRIVLTSSGMEWKIDEKVRRDDYGDIALEYLSDQDAGTPGWVCKDLACHFINYAILPTKQCYLLPVAPLQYAWRKWGEYWKKQYTVKPVPNSYRGRTWRTMICCVPTKELMHRISQAMFFRFQSQPLLEGSTIIQSPDGPIESTNGHATDLYLPADEQPFSPFTFDDPIPDAIDR